MFFFVAVTLWSNEISDVSFVGEAQGNGRTLSTLCRSVWLLEANNLQDIRRSIQICGRDSGRKLKKTLRQILFQKVINYLIILLSLR